MLYAHNMLLERNGVGVLMPSFYDPYVATSLPTDVSYVSSYWTANAINSCDHTF